MSGNTLVAISAIGRCLVAMVALGGAAFLAYHDKPGWGWLILAGVLIGAIGVTTNG